MPLAWTHTTAPTCRPCAVTRAWRSLRARPPFRDCQEFCVGRGWSGDGKAVLEENGELRLGSAPLPLRHLPIFGRPVQHEKEQLQRGVIVREVAARPHRSAQLGVQRLYSVRGVDDPTYLSGEGVEGDHLRPVPAPDLGNDGILAAPRALVEGLQCGLPQLGGAGPVDLLQRRGDLPAIFIRDEVERPANQMHDAGLDLGLREHGADRLGEALQPVDDRDQDVGEATVLQLVHHPQPELGTLGLLDPEPEHLLCAVRPDPERDVHRLVADRPLVAHLDPDRVEKDHRVERLERAVLPFGHLVQHRVCHRADQVGRDLKAVELAQVPLDIAGAHAAGVHRHELVVEAREAALVLGDELRVEGRQPVARDLQIELGGVGEHALGTVAIPTIGAPVRLAGLEVVVQFGVQRTLRQGLLEPVQQAAVGQGGPGIRPSQELVQQLIRDGGLFASRHAMAPSAASYRPKHKTPDRPSTRNGTVNLFVCLDVHRSWRQVTVTDQRTAQDYACCLRDLVDIHYPEADRIRVVQDNLSTHTAGALYETFPPEEAHRLLRRLEFHYTPKHASWLNMVEIEIGVLRGQCLDRRIGERDQLVSEIDAWVRARNASGARINWMFDTQRAREKLARAYPVTSNRS